MSPSDAQLIKAFEAGAGASLHLYLRNIHPREQVDLIRYYLKESGVEITEADGAVILCKLFLEEVRKEENDERSTD